MASRAQWTFMVYLAGDNNLSAAGDTDLAEMRKVGSTPAVNVVAQFDNAGDHGTRRFLIQKQGARQKTWKLPETDSGDPRVLIDFVKWAAKEFPAEKYALVLWNHGGGWEPAEFDRIARKGKVRGFNVREAAVRSASPLRKLFFRTSLKTILAAPTARARAILSDDGSGHSLDTLELGRVLARCAGFLKRPIDLLGMDACLMSNLEVAYQVRKFARTMVASEESEPGDGWPYDAVLRVLTKHPDITPGALGAEIVSAYSASYSRTPETVTQTALDLTRIDEVTALLDTLAGAVLEGLPQAARAFWAAQKKTTRFYDNTLWDLAQFCEELGTASTDPSIRHAASTARASLRPGADQCVLAESHRGNSVTRCGGVSVYLPALAGISPYYAELEFATEHRWLEMLKHYEEA